MKIIDMPDETTRVLNRGILFVFYLFILLGSLINYTHTSIGEGGGGIIFIPIFIILIVLSLNLFKNILRYIFYWKFINTSDKIMLALNLIPFLTFWIYIFITWSQSN
jgi:hypothetical protein